jgi:hypothetical protein
MSKVKSAVTVAATALSDAGKKAVARSADSDGEDVEQPLLFVEMDHAALHSSLLIESVPQPKRRISAAKARAVKPKTAKPKSRAKKATQKKPKATGTPRATKIKSSAKVTKTGSVVVAIPPAPQPIAKSAPQPIPAQTVAAIPATVAPIPRNVAPVVYRKNGPLAMLRYWLRSIGRNFVSGAAPIPQQEPETRKWVRSRHELLMEIVALRKENTRMRKQLGLPTAAFGRQVADEL